MTDFEKLVLEKLCTIETDISGMKTEINGVKDEISGMKTKMDIMERDISTLKKTALRVETDLVPKTQLMLDNYMSIATKVKISDDLYEEVKTLRFEVDALKLAVANK